MPLNLPQRGDNNWDTPLNAALVNLDTRLTALNGVSVVSIPTTNASAGSVGQIASNSTHFYVCVATNSWIRVAKDAW